MSLHNASLPLPMYTITNNLEIIGLNQAAINLSTAETSILDIIESESRSKVENHLQQFKTVEALEANVVSHSGDIILADIFASWNHDGTKCDVIIVKKDLSYAKMEEQLSRLHKRLTDTNFELLHAKETAETLLHENIKLSSPFIKLTDSIALIPIFGELDERKSEYIYATLSQRVYNTDVETVIIDFTAVGSIAQGGLKGFEKLVSILQLLGFHPVITGLHPDHVKEWNALDFDQNVRFIKSLQLAMREIVK